MELPEIIKDRMDLEVNDQISVTLFPDDEGQPKCDVLKLNFTEIEGKKTSLYMTPCEAMEIASALNTAVQFYLYNQEQYREEILKKRLEESTLRMVESKESASSDYPPKDYTSQILTILDDSFEEACGDTSNIKIEELADKINALLKK